VTKKLSGIDLDIEPEDAQCDNSNTLKLVARFRKEFPTDFYVTFAPMAADLTRTDGSGSAFSAITYPQMYRQSVQAGVKIDWFNVQFYNTSYSMNSPSDYEKIIAFGQANNSFGPWQIVAGVETTGAIDYNTFVQSAATLAGKYNTKAAPFGGVMGWEYFNSDPKGTSAPQDWAKGVRKAMDQARPSLYRSITSRLQGLRVRLQPAMYTDLTRSNQRQNSVAGLFWIAFLIHIAAIILTQIY